MATPKTQKTKKIAQDVHTSERATLKAKHTAVRIYAFFLCFLFGSSEIFDAGVRVFLLLLFNQGLKR